MLCRMQVMTPQLLIMDNYALLCLAGASLRQCTPRSAAPGVHRRLIEGLPRIHCVVSLQMSEAQQLFGLVTIHWWSF